MELGFTFPAVTTKPAIRWHFIDIEVGRKEVAPDEMGKSGAARC